MAEEVKNTSGFGKMITRLVALLNVIAGIALIAAHFSSSVNPAKHWWLELFAISYPVWLVINFAFMFFWIIRLHRFILISFIAIAITFQSLRLFFQWHFSDDHASKHLKVMTYNVRLFDLYNWTGNLKTRAKIFDLLRDANPDIVSFQEYFTRDEGPFHNTDSLRNLLKAESNVAYGITLRKIDHWGLATFSKYPIIHKGIAFYEEGNTNFAIYTDIVVNKKDTIRIYNAHLQSNHFKDEDTKFLQLADSLSGEEAMKRSESILKGIRNASIIRGWQADQLHAHIESSPYPVIVCGDFNDPPFSYAYHQVSKNLKDAYAEKGRGFGVSYSGAVPYFRIDYILHDQKFDCTGYKKINSKLSDHFPITAEFVVRNEKKILNF